MNLTKLLDPFYFEITERKFNVGSAYVITSRADTKDLGQLLIDRLNTFFIEHEFVQLTIEVRELQKMYFETKDIEILKACKHAENQLDTLIHKMKRFKEIRT